MSQIFYLNSDMYTNLYIESDMYTKHSPITGSSKLGEEAMVPCPSGCSEKHLAGSRSLTQRQHIFYWQSGRANRILH